MSATDARTDLTQACERLREAINLGGPLADVIRLQVALATAQSALALVANVVDQSR